MKNPGRVSSGEIRLRRGCYVAGVMRPPAGRTKTIDYIVSASIYCTQSEGVIGKVPDFNNITEIDPLNDAAGNFLKIVSVFKLLEYYTMNPYYVAVSLVNLISKFRRSVSFILVAVVILGVDTLFYQFYNPMIDFLNSRFGIALKYHQLVNLDFAPEIWAGVLAMVLGTLIIVIAIAAESTPRLIDLYMTDWTSLFFIWFIVLASLHAFVIMFYGKPMERNSSVILNTYGFLTLSYVLALPYIFYILIYSKTSNVVTTLSKLIMRDVNRMTTTVIQGAMEKETIVAEYQAKILESLDQLDDLLSFVEFKETQSDIIKQIGNISRKYIVAKGSFNEKFFKLTKVITGNATYRTYTEQQYLEMQDSSSFFEVKIFRLLGNSYIKMLENDQYDIASLIPAELVDIGKKCIEVDNPQIQAHINIRFNTLFRFAIKHAIRKNEPRNLYNLAFHFSNMIQAYIRAGKVAETKECYERVKFYGNEIFKNALSNPALYFIVDTLTFELKKCQVLVKELNWSTEDQLHLLKVVLDLDQPPNFSKDDIDKTMLGGNNGTRRIQIGLALYYLDQGMADFAETIIEDYLDDLAFFDEKEFKAIVDGQCFLLNIYGPTFWEDTDRGNLNIYYAPEKDQIQTFKDMLNEQIKRRLRKLEADSQYLSMEVESLLNKRHIQDGFLNDADAARLEDLQRMISIRKSSETGATGWSGENDLIFTLISIAFSDRDIDESEKDVIQETFKAMLPDISDDQFNSLFIPTTQKYIQLKEPEAQMKQYVNSLSALSRFFEEDSNTLRKLLQKYVDLANADSFVHENEVKLVKMALKIWHLEGEVTMDDEDRLVYSSS